MKLRRSDHAVSGNDGYKNYRRTAILLAETREFNAY